MGSELPISEVPRVKVVKVSPRFSISLISVENDYDAFDTGIKNFENYRKISRLFKFIV